MPKILGTVYPTENLQEGEFAVTFDDIYHWCIS